MARMLPRKPIEGASKVGLIHQTKIFADLLEESCEDSIYRVMLYSYEGNEICMKAIISDEDGRLFAAQFQMNSVEKVLRVSRTFKCGFNRARVFDLLREGIINYIDRLNEIMQHPVSAVIFDVGGKYESLTCADDPKEPGSLRVYMNIYNPDDYGLVDLKSSVGAEMINM